MARAIILSAGLGTRLRPLTEELPKALVPLGDRPLAAHAAERLLRGGFNEIVMNTHHLAEVFPSIVRLFPVEVHLVMEPTIRGTAGGIRGARDCLGPGPVVAWNADILADPPLSELLASASNGGLAFAVAPRPAHEGTMGVGADGTVVRLRGREFGAELVGGDYIGVAALGSAVLDTLPAEGCLIADVALPRLSRGLPVLAVAATRPWRDVGSLTEYWRANLAWLADLGDETASWVHPTARVAGAVRLERSIVGENAVVTGEGAVVESVIWPGARARAPLARAIVTAAGAVVHP